MKNTKGEIRKVKNVLVEYSSYFSFFVCFVLFVSFVPAFTTSAK